MRIVDLTHPFHTANYAFPAIMRRLVPLKSAATQYTGVVYEFTVNSMTGSYVDFPGHIAETADGLTASSADPAAFYRMPCAVAAMDLPDRGGAVSGADLEKALGGKVHGERALIVNALGQKNPLDIEGRSVWLDHSAVRWIIDSGIKVLISDVFESQALEGVFLKLFGAGISTVCMPWNLAAIRSKRCLVTVAFPKIPDAVQLPCSVIAEVE